MAPHLLPAPAILGAPSKFGQWRDYQDQAIFDAAETDKRFVLQVVPTGAGKSLIYTMLAVLLGVRTCILTRTKALQDQLTEDFTSMGMRSIKGMNAYACRAMEPGGELFGMFGDQAHAKKITGCDEGPCRVGASCTLKAGGCDYYDDLGRSLNAPLVVTNYTYWMNQYRHGKGLGNFGLLVLDEAHEAPDALSEFLTVELEPWMVSRIGAQLLDGQPTADQWRLWAGHHAVRVEQRADALAQDIKKRRDERVKVPKVDVDEAKFLKRLAGILNTIRTVDESWVCYWAHDRRRWVFTPAWPAPYAEQALFLGAPKVVLTSATVRPKTANYLGIKDHELHTVEYPAIFPAYRRPVVHIPTCKVHHKMTEQDTRQWIARIDQIISRRLDRKGIIHTVSYARAKALMLASQYGDRMITHSAEGTRLAITRFKTAARDSGAVLVSPSVTTGYDFPYEDCEYQIITKIPFPDSRDPVLQARTNQDPDYGLYMAMQTLVQSAGRGMRAADDLCEVFIVDDNVRWFVWRNKHLAPKWFLDTLKTRDLIPAAPPRLSRQSRGAANYTTNRNPSTA